MLIAPAVSSRGGAGGEACEGILPELEGIGSLLEGDVGRDGRAEGARVAPGKAGGEVREGVIGSGRALGLKEGDGGFGGGGWAGGKESAGGPGEGSVLHQISNGVLEVQVVGFGGVAGAGGGVPIVVVLQIFKVSA